MNYNRYLDIHLCTSTAIARVKETYNDAGMYFTSNHTEYFYQFTQDIMRQMRYRESKTEGFTFNEKNKGNCRILSDVELTDADDGFLSLGSTLDTTGGGRRVSYSINEQLKQLRYVGCMVSIEKLGETNTVYPQLRALMLWISDPTTVNKLRINCHGEGTSTGVMTMGNGALSAEQLVAALVRHGLTRPSTRHGSPLELAQNARWKLDPEKAACENCNKKFGTFRRQHHCRRCGGLFCDACSSKKADLAVALTGEKRGEVVQQTATARNVKKARVCDKCYKAVTSSAAMAVAEDAVLADVFRESVAVAGGEGGLSEYGLKTITLAVCMGAKADDVFSAERDPGHVGPFVRDSLASRLLAALRDPNRNLRGIKVAASNQVLAGSDDGILAQCGVDFPKATKTIGKQIIIEQSINSFAKRKGTFEIPAYIWGDCALLRRKFQALSNTRPSSRNAAAMFSGDIKVSPDCRSLYFSNCTDTADLETVQDQYLAHWDFTSWHSKRANVPAQPGGVPQNHTWLLTAPPRVTGITPKAGAAGANKDTITITGRETEYFKDYKSCEES